MSGRWQAGLAFGMLLLGLAACGTPSAGVGGVPGMAAPPVPVPQTQGKSLTPVAFSLLPGWGTDNSAAALSAFQAGCANRNVPAPPMGGITKASDGSPLNVTSSGWKTACEAARSVPGSNETAARAFFERNFTAYMVSNDGDAAGLFTGYYEAEVRGSRTRGGIYQTPLMHMPKPSASRQPRLPSRAAIYNGALSGQHLDFVWLADPVDAFFMEIQGSGRVKLPNGEVMRVTYEGQNGHKYIPIGRVLVDQGEMQMADVSLQSIRAWLEAHPALAVSVMNENPSYVFFRELHNTSIHTGPPGAAGVGLTPGRSVAVDRKYVPMGTPMWIATRDPSGMAPWQHLVVAQDTGGAIRGPIRADIFFGWTPEAEQQAGKMNQHGYAFLLLPKSGLGR